MLTEVELITTKEAAARLGCKPITIRKAIDEGRLKGEKLGRDWLVYVDEQFSRFTLNPAGRGRRKVNGHAIDQKAYRQQIEEALKLAEELDPVIDAGTLGQVDATDDIYAVRGERVKPSGGD